MKYTTKFSIASKILAKDIVANTKNLSTANLENLKPLTKLDIKTSDNLAVVAFDLAVPNMFNLNGDGIDTETAKTLLSKLVNQPVNVEHNRWEVVGHAINSGFYSRPDHNPIGPDDLTSDPFFISVGAILYKSVRGSLVEWIKIENEEGYMMASSSWEISFEDYKIARGSNLLGKCKILDSKADIEKYSPFLRCHGGTGFDDEGTPVFRLISGEVDAIGMAITFTPAADVKGIYMADDDEDEDEENDSSNKKVENKISQLSESHVVVNRENQTMTKEELIKALKEAMASEKDATSETILSTAATVAEQLFTKAIKDADQKFFQEKEALETLKKESAAKQSELEKQISTTAEKMKEMEQQLSKANESIQKAEKDRAEQAKASKLDAKMAEFDAKFDLSKEERGLALAELAASDMTDESIAKFESKYSVLFASKVKKAAASSDKEAEKEISAASTSGTVVTSSSGTGESLSERIKGLKLTIKA